MTARPLALTQDTFSESYVQIGSGTCLQPLLRYSDRVRGFVFVDYSLDGRVFLENLQASERALRRAAAELEEPRLSALAVHLLTLLGEAGEDAGLSKSFRSSGKRTRREYSLFRQGSFWCLQIPTMPQARLTALMAAFQKRLRRYKAFHQAIGWSPESE